MQNKKTAFTLVELIVVITILAILGTIAFISMSGYSATSRDSVRLADSSSMRTSLEIYQVNSGKYPLPDQNGYFEIDSETLWWQGKFNGTVIDNLSRNFSEAPQDPLSEKTYTYSVAGNKNEYQLLVLLEGDDTALNSITETNAATQTRTPKVSGTYNGLYIKTATKFVALPSIISSLDYTQGANSLTGSMMTSLVVNGYANVPNEGNIKYVTGALDIPETVYSTGTVSSNDGNGVKASVVRMLQNAYSGSNLSNDGIYKYITDLDENDDELLAGVLDTVVLGNAADVVITSNVTAGNNDCISGTTSGYTHGSIINGQTESVTKASGNGSFSTPYSFTSATASCNNGLATISGENSLFYLSCKDILDNNLGQVNLDGTYIIDPELNTTGFKVYCDMSSDGGGWSLIATLNNSAGTTSATWLHSETNIGGLGVINSISDASVSNSILQNIQPTEFRWHPGNSSNNIDLAKYFYIKPTYSIDYSKLFVNYNPSPGSNATKHTWYWTNNGGVNKWIGRTYFEDNYVIYHRSGSSCSGGPCGVFDFDIYSSGSANIGNWGRDGDGWSTYMGRQGSFGSFSCGQDTLLSSYNVNFGSYDGELCNNSSQLTSHYSSGSAGLGIFVR